MIDEQEAETGRRPRRFRTVSEKRRIAELTFLSGASILQAAQARAYLRAAYGRLDEV